MASTNYIKQQLKILGWIIIGWFFYSLYIQLMNQLYLGHFRNYVDFTAESIGFDFRKELITTAVVSVLGASIFGGIELFVLKHRFKNYSIGKKLVLKGIIHAIIILALILVGSVFYNSLRFRAAPYDSQVLGGVRGFMTSTGLIGNYMFIYMGVLLTLVLLTINEQLGPGRLKDLLMGRYNRAIKEKRIFMFLDLRSSTLLAEKLGHELYFAMLNKFFADITEPILEFGGKVYQYVGDEVVITWRLGEPIDNQRCLRSFQKMLEVIERERSEYVKRFNCTPEFKAGLHCGEVTTGEVGMIKKEIIHTGDVLNTTARIEKKCNEFQQSLILSKDLMDQLPDSEDFNFVDLGIHELRGKENATRLYGMLDQFKS